MNLSRFRAEPIVVIALTVLLDQLSKSWITRSLATTDDRTLRIFSWLDFIFSENPGISMSLLLPSSPLQRITLTALTGLITLGVIILLARSTNRILRFAYALVAGGAIGNLVDRIRLGHVVDFIHVHAGDWSFYIFNLADTAISIGVATLLVTEFFAARKRST